MPASFFCKHSVNVWSTNDLHRCLINPGQVRQQLGSQRMINYSCVHACIASKDLLVDES